MKQGVIYKIENLVNGKVYIGKTIQTFQARVLRHKSSLRRNTHYNTYLQSSWNKYGEDNFSFEIIQECKVSEIDELEIKWIKEYDSFTKKDGYNLTSGGDGPVFVAEEIKEKMRKSRFVKVVLVNTGEIFNSIIEASEKYGVGKNNITMCCKKDRNFAGRLPNGEWMVWRYLEEYNDEEDYCFKMKRANNKKVITCLNTKETFKTLKEAAEKYSVRRQSITKVLVGEQKSCLSPTHGRLQFCYGENKNKHPIVLNDLRKPRKVICLTTNEVFDSVYQAVKTKGISSNANLISCCKGIRNFCGANSDGTKLRWAYYDEHLSS